VANWASTEVTCFNHFIGRLTQFYYNYFLETDASLDEGEIAMDADLEEDENAKIAAPCQIFCSQEPLPVCGSDGITYLNLCHLDAHNECRGTRIEKAHDGECPPHEHCVPDHNPTICHCNDGHVVCRPRIRCNNVFKPVCGTDGRTYQNACQLAVANACFNPDVRVCHKGPCHFGHP
jgi:hypothetical protein